MSSLVHAIKDQPFIRYLRAQPLETPQAPAPDAAAAVHDAAAPAPAAPEIQAAPAANAHLAGIEKTWLAKGARKLARGTGWMSAMRLVSDNSPLLQIPTKGAPLAATGAAFFCKDGLVGVVGAMLKDAFCQQLEHFSMNTTYATRAARWSARSAASFWFTAIEGLSQDDVRAWRSRPDYEYPADCNPHDLSPKSDPHCPVLAVGQLANKIEPVMGALIIGAAGLGMVYALYRLDLSRHRRPIADIEAGGVHEPLLGAAPEDAAPPEAAMPAPQPASAPATPVASSAASSSDPSSSDASSSDASSSNASLPEPSRTANAAPAIAAAPVAPVASAASDSRVATPRARAQDGHIAVNDFDADRRLPATQHPELALASMH